MNASGNIRALGRSLLALCGGAALSLGPAPVSAQQGSARPDILVIVVDDAGFMDFGAYGGDARTPNIDALAARGAAFSRYYTSPQCGPSRAMLLTGMDNHSAGIGSIVEARSPEMARLPAYSMRLLPSVQTLADVLRTSGYFTIASGKWGIGEIGENLPNQHGFERSYVLDATGADNWRERPYLPLYAKVDWFEDGKPVKRKNQDYSSKFIVDRAIEYIDQAPEDRPVFAYVAFQAIHIPIQAPKSLIDSYSGMFDQGWDELRSKRFARAKALGLAPNDAAMPAMPASARKWSSLSRDEQAYAARSMQVNAAMMEAMDREIGRVLAYLKAKGRLDNTIVVVTSDNGPEYNDPANTQLLFKAWMAWMGLSNSMSGLGGPDSVSAIGSEWAASSSIPFSLFKFHASEGGLRVPLIVAGPGVRPGSFVGGRAHVFDVMPTLLSLAGVEGRGSPETTPHVLGKDLSPLLRRTTDEVYGRNEAANIEVGGNAAHYQGDWKIRRMPPPQGSGKWELYNLVTDPGETKNLAASDKDRLDRMVAAYADYARKVGVYEDPNFNPVRQIGINNLTKGARNYPGLSLLFALAALAALVTLGLVARRAVFAMRRSKA